jgi:hypothetical protein
LLGVTLAAIQASTCCLPPSVTSSPGGQPVLHNTTAAASSGGLAVASTYGSDPIIRVMPTALSVYNLPPRPSPTSRTPSAACPLPTTPSSRPGHTTHQRTSAVSSQLAGRDRAKLRFLDPRPQGGASPSTRNDKGTSPEPSRRCRRRGRQTLFATAAWANGLVGNTRYAPPMLAGSHDAALCTVRSTLAFSAIVFHHHHSRPLPPPPPSPSRTPFIFPPRLEAAIHPAMYAYPDDRVVARFRHLLLQNVYDLGRSSSSSSRLPTTASRVHLPPAATMSVRIDMPPMPNKEDITLTYVLSTRSQTLFFPHLHLSHNGAAICVQPAIPTIPVTPANPARRHMISGSCSGPD